MRQDVAGRAASYIRVLGCWGSLLLHVVCQGLVLQAAALRTVSTLQCSVKAVCACVRASKLRCSPCSLCSCCLLFSHLRAVQ